MLQKFKDFISGQSLFVPEDPILLAVSGGIDSAVMTWLFREAGYRFALAHCNFGLRGKESDGDERFVRNLAKRYGVQLFVRSFPTEVHAKQKKLSIQMAARELRYEWFEEVRKKEGFRYIATAHHLDDQAETFFINLIRGTGIAGLHGILPRLGSLIRPMLFASRKEIEQFAVRKRIRFREDSSNQSDQYLRNRIRHRVIPAMEKLNPEFLSTLTDTILRLREYEEIGNRAMDEVRKKITRKTKEKIFLDIAGFQRLQPASTMAWELLAPFGFSRGVIADILTGLNGIPGKTYFSESHRATLDRDHLIIEPLKGTLQSLFKVEDFTGPAALATPVKLVLRKAARSDLKKIPVSKKTATVDLARITFPLTIRRWEPGDAFQPFGMNGKKKISRFFIDEKFSLPEKENTWLLCSGDKIVWVIGHRIDHRFRVTPETKQILQVTFKG